jgi:hypothetical protein
MNARLTFEDGIATVDFRANRATSLSSADMAVPLGAVRELVGIESGVVSEVINLESPGVEAPGRRPRHDE